MKTFVVRDNAITDQIAKSKDSHVCPPLAATFSIARLESKFTAGLRRKSREEQEEFHVKK